jgi:hypothetical protein
LLIYAVSASAANTTSAGPVPASGTPPSPSEPCRDNPSSVSPEYPQPAYSTSEISNLFKRPTNATDLLANLKEVLDRKLLVQPTFFDDAVLLKLFNGSSIRWLKPGDPDFGADRWVAPTRVARIRVTEAPTLMTVSIGLNHKCINPQPNRRDPSVLMPANTYDSGYIRITVDAPIEAFTLGTVRRVFGPNPGRADPDCKVPLPLSYPTVFDFNATAFALNEARFGPADLNYEAYCKTNSPPELTDDEAVGSVIIRLLEDDHTLPGPPPFD